MGHDVAASTGPVLAIVGITLFNDTIIHQKPIASDIRVVVGGAVFGGFLALFENVSQGAAVGIAWVALLTVLLTRIDPNIPSPVESFLTWYKQ